ncbi:NB-ARC domain-containing protein [Catenulispora pinisilvae]|uniref:NB-ARC domain-containing protein n=1 Tax=Catenulispora pinisilvae TaxID=2705253 RepID=UPI0018927A71|nr:NB-ARC domain-containing protein [Catenulispora pinisilvae]
MNYPTRDEGNQWEGYAVLQAKFRARPEGTGKDADWLMQEIKKDLRGWAKRGATAGLPDYMVFATNVVLSPVASTGGIDRVTTEIATLVSELNLPLKDWSVWHYDQICRYLDVYQGVRQPYQTFITPGEVLAKLHAAVEAAGQPALPRELRPLISDRQHPERIDEAAASGSVGAPFGRLPQTICGRDRELNLLAADLHRQPSKVRVLTGMGGVGKSALALAHAASVRDDGCDVMWVDASSQIRINEAMWQVALIAGAPRDTVSDHWRIPGRSAADLAWQYLAALDRRWLLVFDDADDLDALTCAESVLPDGTGWVRPPTGAGVGVIVTTRDHNVAAWGSQIAETLELRTLERPDAATVLLGLAHHAGGRAAAEELGMLLGGLPLPLHLAGNYLSGSSTDPLACAGTFNEYGQLLQQAPLVLDEAFADVSGGRQHGDAVARRTVARTFGLSVDLLRRQGTSTYADGLAQPRVRD